MNPSTVRPPIFLRLAIVLIAGLAAVAITSSLPQPIPRFPILSPQLGLASAFLLLWGWPILPAVIAVFAIEAIRSFGISPLPTAGLAAIADIATQTLVTVAATWTWRRFCGGREILNKGVHIFLFIMLPGSLLPILGACLLTPFVTPFTEGYSFREVAMIEFIAQRSGFLVLAPAVIALAAPGVPARLWRRRWELIGCLLVFIFFYTAQTLTGRLFPALQNSFARSYLVLPIVLWIAYRFRGPGVALVMLSMLGALPWLDVLGFPGFPEATADKAVTFLGYFSGVIALVGFGFTAFINERDQHLEDLTNLSRELETQVRARTHRLATVNQELSDVLAVTSHDLKGPLVGIANLTRQMQRNAAAFQPHEWDEALSEIESTSRKMGERVTELLDTQRDRDRAGTTTLANAGTAPPATLLEEARALHDALARSRNVTVSTHVSRSVRRLRVDARSFSLIASNLLVNAILHSPWGATVRIDLSCDLRSLILVVADQGPGIPEEAMTRIFEKFSTASPTATGHKSASGLGLFIVRTLVSSAGGSLRCESTLGEGATFIVELPTHPGADPA